jgi:hypothetical protein
VNEVSLQWPSEFGHAITCKVKFINITAEKPTEYHHLVSNKTAGYLTGSEQFLNKLTIGPATEGGQHQY